MELKNSMTVLFAKIRGLVKAAAAAGLEFSNKVRFSKKPASIFRLFTAVFRSSSLQRFRWAAAPRFLRPVFRSSFIRAVQWFPLSMRIFGISKKAMPRGLAAART